MGRMSEPWKDAEPIETGYPNDHASSNGVNGKPEHLENTPASKYFANFLWTKGHSNCGCGSSVSLRLVTHWSLCSALLCTWFVVARPVCFPRCRLRPLMPGLLLCHACLNNVCHSCLLLLLLVFCFAVGFGITFGMLFPVAAVQKLFSSSCRALNLYSMVVNLGLGLKKADM